MRHKHSEELTVERARPPRANDWMLKKCVRALRDAEGNAIWRVVPWKRGPDLRGDARPNELQPLEARIQQGLCERKADTNAPWVDGEFGYEQSSPRSF